MKLTFGQKLLATFSILLMLSMGVFTISGDVQLRKTTNTYVDALTKDAVIQSTRGITEWLSTRLAITQAAAKRLENIRSDEQARGVLQVIAAGGGFGEVFIGPKEGQLIISPQAAEASLAPDYDHRERGWYKLAARAGTATFTEPYVAAGNKELVITAVETIKNGRYEGVVGADIGLGAIDDLLGAITLAGTGYAGLVNEKGVVLYHPDRKLISGSIDKLIGISPKFDGGRQYYETNDEHWRVAFHPIQGVQGVDWYLGTFVNVDKVQVPMQSARITGLIIAVVALLISLLILHFGLKVLMAPVRRLASAMADISSGDADLTQRLDDSAKDEFGELARNFNRFVENIQSVVRDVQSGSDDLVSSVASLKKTASVCRQSVDGQQAEVDMVAAAINEMSAAAGEIAQSAQQTADAANTADSESRTSLETVEHSRDTVRKLSQEVNTAADVINNLGKDVTSITSVLEVIQGIAEQTNLLALNAAIEAARAGEAGRGFAVVADEVRNLAHRTQASTKEINSMIERLQKGANGAVAVMSASRAASNVSMEKAQDAMDALNRVAEAITSISQMTMQIATASEEQTSVTEELNSSITRIADQGHKTSTAASENDIYSGEVEDIGQTLSKNVSRFKV